MAANQKQIGDLLKALVAKGIDPKDAIPTIKLLAQARIFCLDEVNEDNLPPGIDAKVRVKLLRTKRKAVKSSSKASSTKRSKTTISIPPVSARPTTIQINRSPVLTLWAAIVAQTLLKVSFEEALSLGSAYAAQTAKGKGTTLGIFQSADDTSSGEFAVTLMGNSIPVQKRPDGTLVALANDNQEQDAHRTWKLLQKRFGDGLGFCIAAMERAAESAGSHLEKTAYRYYMHIRPDIPQGTKGWGAHGTLHTANLCNFYDQKEKAS